VFNLIGWPLMHKPRNIKFSAVSTLDVPSLVDESASQASRNTSLSVLQPRQPGWSQWHASAVTFFESWQIWLQYFCLSGAIQLQAGCAHFFVSAIPVPPTFTNLVAFKKKRDSTDVVTLKVGDWFSQNHEIFPRIAPVDQWIRRSY
jgi:hypothetical protein